MLTIKRIILFFIFTAIFAVVYGGSAVTSEPTEEEIEEIMSFFEEIVDTIECLICKSIPIGPCQCDKCDEIFCDTCIYDYMDNQIFTDKCPKCKQRTKIKPFNTNMKKLTTEKLIFSHSFIFLKQKFI